MPTPKPVQKILAATAFGLVLLLGILVAALFARPPALLRIAANYSAKIVCSNVFLVGRDPDEVLRDDVQSNGNPVLRLMRVSVDRDRQLVRAGVLGFIGDGLAVVRPGEGCAVLADGKLAPGAQALSPPETAGVAGPAAKPAADAGAAWPDGNAVGTGDPRLAAVIGNPLLAGPGVRAVVVVHRGRIVAERYAQGIKADTPLLGWSMAKSVTAGLIGILVKDGRLALDASAGWPVAPGDGRSQIKIADLLAMSSGLHFDEQYAAVTDVTRMLYLEPDTAGFAYAQPLVHPIGESWSYSSGTANIVARIVQNIAGVSTRVQDRLFMPLRMHSAVIEPDEHGTLVGSSYMYATARDWARYAQFLLQNGVWQGQQLLPAGYVDMMAAPLAASHGEYGHGFVWLWGSDPVIEGQNPDPAFGIPPDTFYLSGHDGQSIAVIRSRQIAVIRLGLTPYADRYSPQRLIQAVLEAKP